MNQIAERHGVVAGVVHPVSARGPLKEVRLTATGTRSDGGTNARGLSLSAPGARGGFPCTVLYVLV